MTHKEFLDVLQRLECAMRKIAADPIANEALILIREKVAQLHTEIQIELDRHTDSKTTFAMNHEGESRDED